MKQPNLILITAIAMLAIAFHAAPASSAMPIAFTVSGTVTSVAGGDQIVIDGKSYTVQVQGPALGELEQVHVGQKVAVVLNGPPGAAATQVVDIQVQNAH
ncbi:MAG TPA: hypothetical protein VHX52_03475 [Steroidobacteraceae bacterium]|jgi:multidrug resistance efflux pump|nr:hypothetical protein [Steroidobacteraceae bacterium]